MENNPTLENPTPNNQPSPETNMQPSDQQAPQNQQSPQSDPPQQQQQQQLQTDQPQEYTDFKIPESLGFDDDKTKEFKAFAAELKLPQEAAQKLMNKYGEVIQHAVNSAQEEQVKRVLEWESQIKNDPDIGGAKLQENLAFGVKALAQFAPPGLKAILDESGIGSHPDMVKFAVNVGKAIAEDKFVSGAGAPPSQESIGELMFYNSK